MVRKFDRELDRNRDRDHSSITQQLPGKLGIVYEEIDRNLVDLDQSVEAQEASAAPLLNQLQSLTAQFQSISLRD